MSELIGKLDRTIEAQGPDSLLIECRNALAAAYQTISDLHLNRRAVVERLVFIANSADTPDDVEDAIRSTAALANGSALDHD